MKFLFPVYYGAKYTSNKVPKHIFLEGLKYYNHALLAPMHPSAKPLQQDAIKQTLGKRVTVLKADVQSKHLPAFDIVAKSVSAQGPGTVRDGPGRSVLYQRKA